MNKKTYKVGDKVTTFLYHSAMKKIKVKGTIKKVKAEFGRTTYTIADATVGEFNTRTLI